MQPRAFCAEHDSRWSRPVPFGVVDCSICRRADDPNVTLFQLLDQTVEVGDSRHGQMFNRASGCFRHSFVQTGSATLRNEHAVHACAFSRPRIAPRFRGSSIPSNSNTNGSFAPPFFVINSSRTSASAYSAGATRATTP